MEVLGLRALRAAARVTSCRRIGGLWIRGGQRVICQSGDVGGRFTGFGGEPGQRLPLIVTRAGRAEIRILAEVEEGDSPGFGIIDIDATASAGTS